jgi:hypothetical protein
MWLQVTNQNLFSKCHVKISSLWQNLKCYKEQLVTYWLVSVQDHGDSRGDTIVDVDPEIIRKGVRSLMQQVAQIERERV